MSKNGIEFSKVWAAFTTTAIPESGILPVSVELRHPGVKYELKKAWIQLSAKNGNCVYIAIQKKVRHVHLSGFGKGWVGTEPTKPNGRVQAQLDFSLPDDTVLAHLEMLLIALPTLAKEETKRQAPMGASSRPKAPKTPGTQKGAREESASLSEEASKEKALRAQEKLQKLVFFAAQRGVPISRETFEKYCTDGADPLAIRLPEGVTDIRKVIDEESDASSTETEESIETETSLS